MQDQKFFEELSGVDGETASKIVADVKQVIDKVEVETAFQLIGEGSYRLASIESNEVVQQIVQQEVDVLLKYSGEKTGAHYVQGVTVDDVKERLTKFSSRGLRVCKGTNRRCVRNFFGR